MIRGKIDIPFYCTSQNTIFWANNQGNIHGLDILKFKKKSVLKRYILTKSELNYSYQVWEISIRILKILSSNVVYNQNSQSDIVTSRNYISTKCKIL